MYTLTLLITLFIKLDMEGYSLNVMRRIILQRTKMCNSTLHGLSQHVILNIGISAYEKIRRIL